jgi:hypothetical protein
MEMNESPGYKKEIREMLAIASATKSDTLYFFSLVYAMIEKYGSYVKKLNLYYKR